MNIAFVLLTYGVNEPAGIERSIAALSEGCRRLGHRSLIVTAATAKTDDASDVVGLETVHLPRPAVEDDLLRILSNTDPVCAEVRSLLRQEHIDLVCWADVSWGLGFLSPAPAGVHTLLRLGVLRTDALMHAALAHRPQVFTCSPFLIESAQAAGLDVTGWQTIPNTLYARAEPPGPVEREHLRREGPVRIAARAEPHKGVAEFIDAVPRSCTREVEIALAPASFEYWRGMQDDVLADCGQRARRSPSVRVVPSLDWNQVPAFFAHAAVSVNCSTSPETFGLAAAESLSVGTPVAHYTLGYLPHLIGSAGPSSPLAQGPHRLWNGLDAFLADHERYHDAAATAVQQVAHLAPEASAARLLSVFS